MEKQPACAAPISSSGFVPGASSIRLLKEYDPSKAPLPSRIVPDPSCNDRCHLASAVRTGISGHLTQKLFAVLVMLVECAGGCRQHLERAQPIGLCLSVNAG